MFQLVVMIQVLTLMTEMICLSIECTWCKRYKTEMTSKECNSGDPLETPGGLYRGPPSNENTIFKKTCMPNIKFKSVQCSFTMNVNQLQ